MLIDTHCHLDFPDFESERDELILRAKQAGVAQMVTISTRVKKIEQVIAIAEKYGNVFCSVGTHPANADEELDIEVSDLILLTKHPKVVAIGEAGLDYHYEPEKAEAQKIGLIRHIAAARITGLPLVIHSRAADSDMADILRDETEKGAFSFILHCFSSSRSLAETGIKLGGYISFSGILTFKKSDELRSIAADVPLDRLLVETDAPYLAPTPFRGKRNEPAYVVNTARVLAEVKGMSEVEMAGITTENAFRCFSKMVRI